MSNIAELEHALREAEVAYHRVLEAYNSARKAAHPFQLGDIIRSADGKLAKVTGIVLRSWGVGTNAVLQNKNGEFGLRAAPMWRTEWKNAVLHERPTP